MCAQNDESSMPLTLPTVESSALRDAVQLALKNLMMTDPDLANLTDVETWVERVTAILAQNVSSGRNAWAVRSQQPASPSLVTYAQHVWTLVLAEWERVEALRAGDTARWQLVLQRMERRAYFWLGPSGREEWTRWEAREMAAKTCAGLWQWLQSHPFPFDIAFDCWSECALNHRLHESVRNYSIDARHVVDSLDHPRFEDGVARGELLPTDDMRVWLERESRREMLREAYARLDQRLARIVQLWYVEGWSAQEIATETSLEVGHIYVLKHRAIKKLREYCAADQPRGRSSSRSHRRLTNQAVRSYAFPDSPKEEDQLDRRIA